MILVNFPMVILLQSKNLWIPDLKSWNSQVCIIFFTISWCKKNFRYPRSCGFMMYNDNHIFYIIFSLKCFSKFSIPKSPKFWSPILSYHNHTSLQHAEASCHTVRVSKHLPYTTRFSQIYWKSLFYDLWNSCWTYK